MPFRAGPVLDCEVTTLSMPRSAQNGRQTKSTVKKHLIREKHCRETTGREVLSE